MALELKVPQAIKIETQTSDEVTDFNATVSMPTSMRFTVENAAKDSKVAMSLREMFAQLGQAVPDFLEKDKEVAKYTTIVYTIALKSGAQPRDIGRLVTVLPELNLLPLLGIEAPEGTNTFVLDANSIILVGYSFPRKSAPGADTLARIPAALEALTVAIESLTVETTPEMDVAALTEGVRGIALSQAVKDAGKKAWEARRDAVEDEEAKKEVVELKQPAYKATAAISPALFASLPIGAAEEDSGLKNTEDAAKGGLDFFVADAQKEAVFAAALKACAVEEEKAAGGGGGADAEEGASGSSDGAKKEGDKEEEEDVVKAALEAVVTGLATKAFGAVKFMASIANPAEDGTEPALRTIAANVGKALLGHEEEAISEDKPISPAARRALTLHGVGPHVIDSLAGVTTFNGDQQALILRMENVTLDSMFRPKEAVKDDGASILESVASALGCGPSRKAAGEIIKEKRGICG